MQNNTHTDFNEMSTGVLLLNTTSINSQSKTSINGLLTSSSILEQNFKKKGYHNAKHKENDMEMKVLGVCVNVKKTCFKVVFFFCVLAKTLITKNTDTCDPTS